MSQFSQPGIASPEDKFTAAEHHGALLLFFPTDLQRDITTPHGTADAVGARVVNLDSGRVMDNALIFPQALVTQLKGAVPDGMVLGRLTQGENKKGNPPWLLQPHSEQDVAVAEQWLAANPRNQFGQPPASAPAPSPAPAGNGGWGAPAASAPVSSPGAGWGSPTPAPAAPAWGAPAPVAVPDPAPVDLPEALRKKGVDLSAITSLEQAQQVWGYVKNNPDVA